MSDLGVSILSSGLVGLEANNGAGEVKSSQSENKLSITKNEATGAKEIAVEKSAAEKATPEEVEEAVVEMNSVMQNMQRNLSFSIDEQLGEPIISITDAETDEVIRQIPSEELVVLRKKLDDVVGILFDTKV